MKREPIKRYESYAMWSGGGVCREAFVDLDEAEDGELMKADDVLAQQNADDERVRELVEAAQERDGGIHDAECKAMWKFGPRRDNAEIERVWCNCGHYAFRKALDKLQDGGTTNPNSTSSSLVDGGGTGE